MKGRVNKAQQRARQQQRRRAQVRRRRRRRRRRVKGGDGKRSEGVMTRSMTKALAREREKKQVESVGGVADEHAGAGTGTAGSGNNVPGCQGCCKAVSLRAKIWGRLTEDLLERICARLPTACLIRLRAVSRRWRAMLSSTSFLRLYAQAPAPPPWFCMFTKIHPDASTYDALLNQWHHVPLPPLPQRNMTAVAAHGGLVCFCSLASDGGVEEVVVCNPLSQTCGRVLAVPACLGPLRRVGLLADAESKTFRMLLAFQGCSSRMFDSGSERWEEVCASEQESPAAADVDAGGGLHDNPAVLCDGVLYWLGSEGGLLEAFHPRRRLWTRWYVPMPAPVLYSRKLVESQSSIFMLGGLPGSGDHLLTTRHICIWRLQTETMQWQEVDRMPSMLCAEFIGDSTHVNFTGSTDQVLLNMRGGSRNSLMVLYDLRTRLWRRVPKCPLPDRRLVWGLKDGIAFQPRIDADSYLKTPSLAHSSLDCTRLN